MCIKVILADDHKIVRNGLRSLLEKDLHMEVIAEAADGREAVELTRKLKPDIIVMDLTMPDRNGIEATRQIVATTPGTKVLALSMHSDRRYIAGALDAGVSGYLLKHCAFDELIRAIQAVAANQTYLSPDIAHIVVEGYANPSANTSSTLAVLTAREREVLQLVAEGKTAKAIASVLSVSIKTVETHRSQIMNKLDIHSVAELTKHAIREGITSLDN